MFDSEGVVAVIRPEFEVRREVEEERLRQEIAPVVAQANSIVILNGADYETAAKLLIDIKTVQKVAKVKIVPFKEAKDKAAAAWKIIKQAIMDPLVEAEETIKDKLSDWGQKQREAAKAEQRQLQAIEDEKSRKEAARLAERARKAEEKGHAEKAEALRDQAATTVAPVVHVQSAAPQVKKITTLLKWQARVVDKPAFLEFAITELTGIFLSAVSVNEKRLQGIPKGDKAPNIPGVKFWQTTQVRSGSN